MPFIQIAFFIIFNPLILTKYTQYPKNKTIWFLAERFLLIPFIEDDDFDGKIASNGKLQLHDNVFVK